MLKVSLWFECADGGRRGVAAECAPTYPAVMGAVRALTDSAMAHGMRTQGLEGAEVGARWPDMRLAKAGGRQSTEPGSRAFCLTVEGAAGADARPVVGEVTMGREP